MALTGILEGRDPRISFLKNDFIEEFGYCVSKLHNPKANLFIFVRRCSKMKKPKPRNCHFSFQCSLLNWCIICDSTNNRSIYEDFNRDFSLVYSFGIVLAISTGIDLPSAANMVDPSSFPDHWIFARSCFQTDWSNSDVSFSIAWHPLKIGLALKNFRSIPLRQRSRHHL